MAAEGHTSKAETMRALQEALENRKSEDISWLPPGHIPWSLCKETLCLLHSLVRHLQPRCIVEFGSGLSTVCLYRACRENNLSCRIVSIDHDPVYQSLARQEMDSIAPGQIAFHLAPLVARSPCENFLPTYHFSPELLDACRHADLVLIDGPPDTLGGREGVLYQVMEFVRHGTLVLLDDAGRESEGRALRRWQDNFGEAIRLQLLEGFSKGLAAITVADPLPPNRLWNHRVRLSARELEQLGRPDDTIVLVDENQWGLSSEDIGHPLASLDNAADIERRPPAGDDIAMSRLKRAHSAGARFVAFGWPAFWWLNSYPGMHKFLETQSNCVLRNERLVVYDLSVLQG